MVLNFGFRAFEDNKILKSRPNVYSVQRAEVTIACGYQAVKCLKILLHQTRVQKILELKAMMNCRENPSLGQRHEELQGRAGGEGLGISRPGSHLSPAGPL